MNLNDRILSMRFGDFGFSKPYSFMTDKVDFPQRINIVKWDESGETNIVIASLTWNKREDSWDFNSVGLRFLEYGTKELSEWLLNFCKTYGIYDNSLEELENE